jgi:hypothetical protein
MMKQFLVAAGIAMIVIAPVSAEEPKNQKEPAKEWTGKLETGIVAIGGETTGVVLTTKNGRFELELGKNRELRDKAEKLNGKEITLTGTLTIRKGLEIKERRIITVTGLKEAAK